MNYFKKIGVCLVAIQLATSFVLAQDPLSNINTDDLGDFSDAFQENFFEALKQKGIENYELALNALNRAEKSAGNDTQRVAVIQFERAKNLRYLERFEEAKENLLSVLNSLGDRLDVMVELYNLYYDQKDFESAIPLVHKLINADNDYKEDLLNLYFHTKRYDEALKLLDELDQSWGESAFRDSMRKRIYSLTGNSEGAIKNLESKIEKNPKNEQDYLNLIYLYSQEEDLEKAFETAKELLQQIPSSVKAHLALYKFYLDKNETDKAIESIKRVFGSEEIEKEAKFKMLGDFLNYVSEHPEMEPLVNEVIGHLSESKDGALYERLGKYFISRNNLAMALQFYEKGVNVDSDNYSLVKNTLLLQIDTGHYQEALQLSESSLALFPAQPLLYLLNGVAKNNLEIPDSAIESLEMGLDFLIDDPKMERDFYQQLSIAYKKLGNTEKANEYAKKVEALQIAN